MASHSKELNDAVIQLALNKIRFEINVLGDSTIDRITKMIRNTLIGDMPSKINKHTPRKSKPTTFCQDISNFLPGKQRNDIHSVETFNLAFNAESCQLIKHFELFERYTSSDKSALNNAEYNTDKKKHTQSTVECMPEAYTQRASLSQETLKVLGILYSSSNEVKPKDPLSKPYDTTNSSNN